jgi:sporulation protein YlmC with PRC-barrel domain
MRLELGKRARCSDGAARELADLVLDAGSRRVTHLVVQPKDNPGDARLVPLELAAAGAGEHEISLRCTEKQLDEMSLVHESAQVGTGEQVEEEEDGWEVGVRDMQVIPDYLPTAMPGDLAPEVVVTYDRVPKGEIELRHASDIYSADRHHLGSVEGVVVDADGRISQLLLGRGRLWWRREISIPAEAIGELTNDMVTLGVNESELGTFPSERR